MGLCGRGPRVWGEGARLPLRGVPVGRAGLRSGPPRAGRWPPPGVTFSPGSGGADFDPGPLLGRTPSGASRGAEGAVGFPGGEGGAKRARVPRGAGAEAVPAAGICLYRAGAARQNRSGAPAGGAVGFLDGANPAEPPPGAGSLLPLPAEPPPVPAGPLPGADSRPSGGGAGPGPALESGPDVPGTPGMRGIPAAPPPPPGTPRPRGEPRDVLGGIWVGGCWGGGEGGVPRVLPPI